MALVSRVKEFHIPVKELILPKRIYACKPETSLKGVIEMMQKHNIGCLVVSNQERETLGIITERDFILKITGMNLNLAEEKVEDFMTPHPTTIDEDEPMLKVLQYMQMGKFRHVIIVDKKSKIRSVFSMRDVMEYLFKTIQAKDL
jgi:CBS domain-containing protein